MLLKSITLCCLMLNVQTQIPFLPQLNPSRIYFRDDLPAYASLLTLPSPNELGNNAVRSVFQNEQPIKKKPTTTVEVERTMVSEFGSTVEEGPNHNRRNNLVNRQVSTQNTPSREITQRYGPQRQSVQISHDRQSALQTVYDRHGKPEIVLDRPTVPIPQSELDRPTIMAQDIFRPPHRAQDRQSIQGQGGQVIQGRPSLAVSQNALDRPAVHQSQSNPPPSTSGFNYATQKAPGFNTLLYSVTNFGVNLLKTIDALHSGNVVVSPISITSLLGLLQQGALGETQAEITNALQMFPETTPPAYAKVFEDILARNSRNILKVANNLFISDDFAANEDFKKVAVRSFSSDVTPLIFSRPGEAARQINSWVASRTENKIENLIAPDAIDSTTQMVLVNAIYFKGLWEVPFRVELTNPKPFQLSNGQTKTAQFMRMRKMFKTGTDMTTNAKVLILPFERDEYHLMVILPSQLVGIRTTLASLTDARLLSYLTFPALDTELELPKFTIRADTDLSVVLKSMGITTMFRRDYSELSGVGSYGAHSPHISTAVHSAVLSIDEKGGTAAAATAFAAVALSYDDPAVEFKVNRPFIAILWDSKSSLPLFIAKIEDPQQ